jgi:hypothetical protein
MVHWWGEIRIGTIPLVSLDFATGTQRSLAKLCPSHRKCFIPARVPYNAVEELNHGVWVSGTTRGGGMGG